MSNERKQSKLDELLRELCPDGVEYKELQAFLKIKNGSDYKAFGEGDIPVYGSGGIMTYIDRYVYNKPSVLIPRKGSIDKLYYVDTPFWNVDTIFYTEINTDLAMPRYVYHCLLREHLEQYNTAGGVPTLTQKVLNKVQIPLPPLPVQREIVRILDKFTELTARKKQYEFYRDKLLTFGDVRGGDVVWRTLGEVIVSLNTGLNPRQFFKLNTDDACNYYVTIREIQNGTIVFSDKTDKINDEALKLCNNRSNLEVGDVLFSGTGTIGETAVISKPPTNWNIKEGVYVIKPRKDMINSRFLMYILRTDVMKAAIAKKVAGGTVKSIPMAEMRKLQIPLPPLPVQREIVRILDKFTELIAELIAELTTRKKQYEFYRDKLLTISNEQVAMCNLGDICESIADGDHMPPPKADTGIPFITISNITEYNKIDFSNTMFVPHAYYDALAEKRKPQKGDVLYTVVGSYGIPVCIEEDSEFVFQRHIAILRPKKQIVKPRYMFHAMQSSAFKAQADKTAKGVAQKTIGLAALAAMKLPVPSLDVQSRIVNVLDNFDAICSDLKIGLPAEIEARKKQYEFYREKLLAFHEISN